jgi:3-hydroxyacyl-CoA dehydrogenase/enoyl-CoA hydratase/3-hydroxybutyryl-CoA epimerase
MINEACKCLDEKVVKNAKYLDIAMILGSGFPPFRGGILKYADKIGLENVVKKLELYYKEYGERFEVSPYLINMLNNKEKFYS